MIHSNEGTAHSYTNRKKVIFLSLLCLLSLFFMACGYTPEEKKQMQEYEEQGEKNAIAYIEDKYGFTPQVQDLYVDTAPAGPIPDFSPDATGNVWVEFVHDGNVFNVFISGAEETLEGYDDYEAGKIADDLKADLEKRLGITIRDIHLSYNKNSDIENFLHEKYVDVDTFVETYQPEIVINTVDKTSEEMVNDLADVCYGDCKVLIVTYKPESYGDYVTRFIDAYSLYDDSIYMDECFRYDSGDIEHHTYHQKEITDGIWYVYDDYYVQSVTITQTEDIDDESNWDGRGFLDARRISDAYRVTMEENDVNGSEVIQLFVEGRLGDGKAVQVVEQYDLEKDGEKKRIYDTAVVFEKDSGYSTCRIYGEDNLLIAVFVDDK